MLSEKLLAADLRYMANLVSRKQHVQEDQVNETIYEVLAYLQKSILPLIMPEQGKEGSEESKVKGLLHREVPDVLLAIARQCKFTDSSAVIVCVYRQV